MKDIDWPGLVAPLLGCILGAILGYLWQRRHPRAYLESGLGLADLRRHAGRHAALMGLAAFAGVALAEDSLRLLGHRSAPAGYFLLKYFFGGAIGMSNYAFLRRIDDPDAAEPEPDQG